MKKFISEFRTFINKGNMFDMAVGVIVGGAFSTIVNSLISDIIMPILGVVLGGVDFSSWVVPLYNLYGGDPLPLNIGLFMNNVVNFLVLAFCVFWMVKGMNRIKKEKPAEPPAPDKKGSCSPRSGIFWPKTKPKNKTAQSKDRTAQRPRERS